MECLHCNETIPSDSRFCNKCGAEVGGDIFVEKQVRMIDTPLLLGYIGWLVLNSVIYVFLQRIVLSVAGTMGAISTLTRINLAITVIDFMLMILVITLSKTKVVKIVFGVFLVVKIVLRVIPFMF